MQMIRRGSGIIFALAAATLVLITLGSCAGSTPHATRPALRTEPEPKGFAWNDKVVIAYYYMWFRKQSFDGHDRDKGDSMKDIHPLVGPYDSDDPQVMEEHIKMAKRGLIDAFAVSWWPNRLFEDDMNKRLATMFELAEKNDFKLCIDLESEGIRKSRMVDALRYYLRNYGNHPAALRLEGKPVILLWGAWRYPPKQWQAWFDELRGEGLDAVYFLSGQLEPRYLGPFRSLEIYTLVDTDDDKLAAFYRNRRIMTDIHNEEKPDEPAQWHATIMPGYDETLVPGRADGPGGVGVKDRADGEYYRMTFEAALASRPDWIHINSFNELAEHSHIEPTREFGYKYIDMTAEFVRRFKSQ